MPSLQTLQEIGVSHVARGQSYTERETILLRYILEHPNEQGYVTPKGNTLNWEAYASICEDHYNVERSRGNLDYSFHTKGDLQQKKER